MRARVPDGEQVVEFLRRRADTAVGALVAGNREEGQILVERPREHRVLGRHEVLEPGPMLRERIPDGLAVTPAEARDVGAIILEDRLDDRGIGPGERRFEVDVRRLRGDRADHLDVEVHLARAGAQRDLASHEAPLDRAAGRAGLAVPGLEVGVEEGVERHDRHGLALRLVARDRGVDRCRTPAASPRAGGHARPIRGPR